MPAAVYQAQVRINGDALILARVKKMNSSYVVSLPSSGDFSSITRTAKSLKDGTTLAGPTSLTIASVIFSSLSTAGGWTRDTTGWNFADLVPASIFSAVPGVWLTYAFTLSGGSVFYLDVACETVTGG